MLRFVASALLALNCIFSTVLFADGVETEVNPFDLYNEYYRKCLALPGGPPTTLADNEEVEAHNGIKIRRKSLFEPVEQFEEFEEELEKEFYCLFWILNQAEDALNLYRTAIYLFYLSIHFQDYTKAQYYRTHFRKQYGETVTPPQMDNAEDFKRIAALLTLFSDNKLYEKVITRWFDIELNNAKLQEAKGEEGAVDMVNETHDLLMKLVKFRNTNKFAEASEQELEVQITEGKPDSSAQQRLASFNKLISFYLKVTGSYMAGMAVLLERFFPDALRPDLREMTDVEHSKLLEKLRASNPYLLASSSKFKESRIVEMLKDLLAVYAVRLADY